MAVPDRLAAVLEGHRVACAESCTAGRVTAALAALGGASAWMRGGLVAYQAAVKRALLGVSAASVFTEQAASEMAGAVARLLDADVAVATTGVLGDEPEEGVAPGTVMVATMMGGEVEAVTGHVAGATPEDRCTAAVEFALQRLWDRLTEARLSP